MQLASSDISTPILDSILNEQGIDIARLPQLIAAEPVVYDDSKLYRGLANRVGASDVESILAQAKLNWDVLQLPVLAQDQSETMFIPGHKALVRSDTHSCIDVVSDKFRVHQNSEIVNGLAGLAQAGNIHITHGGSMNGGARVFLHGSVNRQFELTHHSDPQSSTNYGGTWGEGKTAENRYGQRKGDIVRLDFRMTGGHVPGSPTKLTAVAIRLVCLNGATIGDANVSVKITHRQRWNSEHTSQVERMVSNAVESFTGFQRKATKLSETAFSHGVTRAYVIEALQPELLQVIAREQTNERLSNADLLSLIVEQDDLMHQIEHGRIHRPELTLDRSTRKVLELVNTQPGANLAADTAWNAYNAVSYYTDHVRGRGDAAVESAITGDGNKLKTSALELAMNYTERLALIG